MEPATSGRIRTYNLLVLPPIQYLTHESPLVICCRRKFLTFHHRPFASTQIRKKCIAINVGLDASPVYSPGPAQELPVDISATDHHHLFGIASNTKGIRRTGNHVAPICAVTRLARDNYVLSSGQSAANRLVGQAAHDDWLAHGDRFEALEIFRQVPGQSTIFANYIVCRMRDYD